jgi:hypothetical protein
MNVWSLEKNIPIFLRQIELNKLEFTLASSICGSDGTLLKYWTIYENKRLCFEKYMRKGGEVCIIFYWEENKNIFKTLDEALKYFNSNPSLTNKKKGKA